MPRDAYLPAIDDRRYDDIITEIRTRIPRYAPEWRPGEAAWTDLNDNDPGITLAQVVAWQVDMLLYRLNKVPALNYIKFLELIGVELRPAAPATAEVTLPVLPAHVAPTLIVPARTQLSADPGDGEPPLVFETVRAITALRAQLDAVLTREHVDYNDNSQANQDATTTFAPFGSSAPDGAELALGFNDPGPLPDTELDLAVMVQGSAARTTAVTCGIAASPRFAPAVLRWEYWAGTRWERLKLLKDETVAFTRSGHIRLRLPSPGLAQKTKLVATQTIERFWIRAVLERSQYERPPVLYAIRTNTVPVEQAETIRDEVLGGSDGSRNQRFRLANKPVVAGTLQLDVEQSDAGFEPWTEVEDLFGSSRSDNVFTLNRTTGEIRFGDGVNGNIPVAYVNNPGANVVARTYRVGGGRRGNVPAMAISNLLVSVDGIDADALGNLLPAYGGREEETLDEAKARAPHTLRSRCRAVSVDDFEYLAREAGNVRRAKALPLFDPRFPDTPIPGVISIIVVPDADGPKPMPSDGLLRTVCAYLDPRRLITTELRVLAPHYQHVAIRGEVIASDEADLAEVSTAVNETLRRFFHPLTGGEAGDGWPFGGTVHYSRVYQRVFGVPGVARISQLTIVLDGEEHDACTDAAIAPHALLYATDHDVNVRYDEETDA